MFNNIKKSLLIHAVICLVVVSVGGFESMLIKQLILSVMVFAAYYFFGNIFDDLGSKFKNFLSLSVVSGIGLLLAVICTLIYQFDEVIAVKYAFDTGKYMVARFICFGYNASGIPVSGLLSQVIPVFSLPYGLLFTSLIPSIMLWLGLESKKKRESKKVEVK